MNSVLHVNQDPSKMTIRERRIHLALCGTVLFVVVVSTLMYWRSTVRDRNEDLRLFSVGWCFEMMQMWNRGKAGDIVDADGAPLLSWRVANLPYMERVSEYNRFKIDEPWDSKHNLALLHEMEPAFGTASPKSDIMLVRSKNSFGQKQTFNAALILVDADSAVEWTKPDSHRPTVDEILQATLSFRMIKIYLLGEDHGWPMKVGRNAPRSIWEQLLNDGATLGVIDEFRDQTSVEYIIPAQPINQ